VRPENVLAAARGARGETARVDAEIEIVEPLGHEVIVHGRVGDDVLVAKIEPHRAPRMGARMELVIELDSLHLFDAATERRLTA
jgi:multiple sugar transport system ATP-binding protein